MKTFTEADLKKVDKAIENMAKTKAANTREDELTTLLINTLSETLWELRWAIISHMELQEKLDEPI